MCNGFRLALTSRSHRFWGRLYAMIGSQERLVSDVQMHVVASVFQLRVTVYEELDGMLLPTVHE